MELLQDAQHYGTQQVLKATGGGAHLYHDKLVAKLPFGVIIEKEDEMECLITGNRDECHQIY